MNNTYLIIGIIVCVIVMCSGYYINYKIRKDAIIDAIVELKKQGVIE